jgi:hypothetical protein
MPIDPQHGPDPLEGSAVQYGPDPFEQMHPEPPPFPIDDHVHEQIKKLPPQQEVKARSGWNSVLYQLSQPYLASGYSAASALNRGMAHFADTLDNARKWLQESMGHVTWGPKTEPLVPEDFFEKLAKVYELNADYWKQRADQVGPSFLEELVGEAIGGAVPGITEFTVDTASYFTIPGMAGWEKAQKHGESGIDPVITGLVEAAKVGTLQYLFRTMAPFKRYLQASAMGSFFGAQAVAEAPSGQRLRGGAKGLGTGMLLAGISQPGEIGVRDIYPELGSGIPRISQDLLVPQLPMAEGLKPAIKTADRVTTGEVGETHPDIGPPTRDEERGFVTPQGKFLTRKGAEEWLAQNNPEVHEEWKKRAGEGAEFHSEDYNLARETVQASRRPLPLGAASRLPIDNPPVFRPHVEPTGIWGSIGRIFHSMYKATTIDIVPGLADVGVSNNAVQHAHAREAAPRIVDDLLSRVFPEDYKKPQVMANFIDLLNKDNILGGLDSFLLRASEARVEGDTATAEKWDTLAEAVKQAHDISAYDTEVRKAMRNDKFMQTVQRWQDNVSPKLDQLYNEMKQVDPFTQRDSRGRYLDSRINLLTEEKATRWAEAMLDPDKPTPEPSASSYRNPNVKRDPYDVMATFTGKYSTDAKAVLSAVVGHRWNEVTKIRFYNDLVDNGIGIVPEANEAPPEGYTRMAFRMPHTANTGRTNIIEQPLFVPQNLVREIRSVLRTDMPLKENLVGRVLTGLQLAQLADLTTHTKNIQSVITRAQGAGDVWTDVIRKIPGFGSADTIWRMVKTTREVFHDTPEIRAEIEQMARRGLVRPAFPAIGIQKITRGQQIIHEADTAARIIMNRFFDNLAERKLVLDTEENRRNFVNQVGEYNTRLQGPIMRAAKQSGLSPFIVAGRNFNRQGRWAVTGNPGIEAASTNAAVQMRVLNLLGTAALFTLPMFLNYLTSGKMTGRAGTPIGAWDLGLEPDPKTGKHKVIDLLNWTGARRGMRSIGLDALIQGLMNGDHMNDIAGNALQDAGNTIIHPWNGPAIAFAEKTLTGRQLDLRGIMEVEKLPEGGGLQYVENFRAALESQNPFVYSIVRPAFQELGLDQKPKPSYPEDVITSLLKSPEAAVGARDITPPPTEGERLKREAEIKRARMREKLEYKIGLDRKAQKKRFTILRRRAEED